MGWREPLPVAAPGTASTLTKTDAVTSAEDTVVLYTDIAAPADSAFNDKVYDLDDRTDILNVADRLFF